MNAKYFRIWLLLRERMAREAGKPDAKEYCSKRELLDSLLRVMAILEADAILED